MAARVLILSPKMLIDIIARRSPIAEKKKCETAVKRKMISKTYSPGSLGSSGKRKLTNVSSMASEPVSEPEPEDTVSHLK